MGPFLAPILYSYFSPHIDPLFHFRLFKLLFGKYNLNYKICWLDDISPNIFFKRYFLFLLLFSSLFLWLFFISAKSFFIKICFDANAKERFLFGSQNCYRTSTVIAVVVVDRTPVNLVINVRILQWETAYSLLFFSWAYPFSMFVLFYIWFPVNKCCQWRDSNLGPLVLEASSIPTVL